jgi:hypothetical protein
MCYAAVAQEVVGRRRLPTSFEKMHPSITIRRIRFVNFFKIKPSWAIVFLLWPGPPVLAQRFDVTPLVSYRFGGTFDINPDGQQSAGQAKLQDSAAYGIAAGFRFDEESLVEFRWTRQRTDLDFDALTTIPSGLQQKAMLDQFHGDFTREYIMEDYKWARPFVIGSVGATRVALSSASFTRFSFGLGAGVKFFPHPRLGLRIQAEWLPIWVNPEIKGFACGGGCVVALGGRLASQGEVSIGPVFRF